MPRHLPPPHRRQSKPEVRFSRCAVAAQQIPLVEHRGKIDRERAADDGRTRRKPAAASKLAFGENACALESLLQLGGVLRYESGVYQAVVAHKAVRINYHQVQKPVPVAVGKPPFRQTGAYRAGAKRLLTRRPFSTISRSCRPRILPPNC